MKQKILLCLVLLMAVNACKTGETVNPPKLYTIQQFMDVKNMYSAGFSPDESKILI
ncbi:unnamed protein product, partial [Phaeothamnion confervicola]